MNNSSPNETYNPYMEERLVVVDGDPDILRFIEINLRSAGYDVATATDGHQALGMILEEPPDLVLVEVGLPGLDGFQLAQLLRRHPRTVNTHIIMLTARALSSDKVTGLQSGADDYIVKPFDPIELLARVKGTLRRGRFLRELSPLTGLPGNTRVRLEIQERLAGGRPFAALYVDIDHFKPYNDYYGPAKGDDVIQFLSRLLVDVANDMTAGEAFCGHFGGDDFLILVPPSLGIPLADALIQRFDEASSALYHEADAKRGFIRVADRDGKLRKFTRLTLSVGIASTERRAFSGDDELLATLAKMKQLAKRKPGSSVAIARAPRGDVTAPRLDAAP